MSNFLAQISQWQLPSLPGQPLTSIGILGILTFLANFLIAAGIILAIIVIVWSGVMYLKSGSNEKAVDKAKGWFKNGIIGAFIILAVGVIILTLYNIIVTRTFFGPFGP
ncbi:MAG: hypothetical protein AAB469_01230 [Patescibacteria group bacterium]